MCFFGHLDGWSWGVSGGHRCQYKGCEKDAVFDNVPGAKRRVCMEHAERVKVHRTNGPRIPLKDFMILNRTDRARRFERVD